MKQNTIKWFVCAVFLGILVIACAGTELTDTQVHKTVRDKPVSNILVIGIADKENNRRYFENEFVTALEATGVKAVSSADVISIPADKELKKDVILDVVNKFKNDAVIITHVAGVEKKDVYTPPTRSYGGYYDYYNNIYLHTHEPGYYSTHTQVRLKTNLYDVKTERLLWSGQSKTINPGSTRKVIDEVIQVVVKDLQKNKLLP